MINLNKSLAVAALFLFLSTESYSQKIDLSGTVISVYGNPIPGLH
jgi:hypothetical protein